MINAPFQEPMLRDVSPGDQTTDLHQRRNFCNKTYKALDQISDVRGWYFRPRQQVLMKEVGDHIVVGKVEFAGNSKTTWVDAEFEPSGLKPLAFEIIFGKTMDWDLEIRSDHLTKIEVPNVKSLGWLDTDVSPEENASKIIGAMEQITAQLPIEGAYSDFLQTAKHPSLYRAAEAMSLILEGKYQAARELAEAILGGEVRRSGLVAEQEIMNWLDRVPTRRD